MPLSKRLRYTSLLSLWSVVTRAVVKDASLSGWGFSLALLCACFLLFVSRSQLDWLGKPRDFWWIVGVRAEIAAFAAVVAPKSWCLPLFVFLLVYKATGVADYVRDEGTLWRCAPLVLLLRPATGYFLDIFQVGLLVAARHYESSEVVDEPSFYREHEKRLALDLFGMYVLASSGALYATRFYLFLGSAALTVLVHFKYPRTRGLGYWDAVNAEKRHVAVPFRQIS